MFYAARHTYDINVCNDYCTLYRFATKAERDQFVEDRNFAEASGGNLKTEELACSEARRHFPEAFRLVGNFHEESDKRDWLKRDNYEFWSADNLWNRDNYML